ncbi:MAG: DUF4886 domain-containing protein [Muribaculaceae bacterium]|nr:DUF4886 domain-containing protein [Muribaculaceae bacterium]
MKLILNISIALWAMALALTSCGCEPEVVYTPMVERPDSAFLTASPLWQRHRDTPLKILCIGNSFTHNATTYMPWLINRLNADSICIAMLTRAGCSLKMHWENHMSNREDYDFFYSERGHWVKSDEIKTIDIALTFFDWDIITLQQASGSSGLYSTYQPYLDNLESLFRDADPDALLAWHYTWAYTAWTEHREFKNYGYNPRKMYEAIMEAGDKASERFDITLPSATLIKMLREECPEVKYGFSEDGFHITEHYALYALSALWYEVLVGAPCGTSCLPMKDVPSEVGEEGMKKISRIITRILNH